MTDTSVPHPSPKARDGAPVTLGAEPAFETSFFPSRVFPFRAATVRERFFSARPTRLVPLPYGRGSVKKAPLAPRGLQARGSVTTKRLAVRRCPWRCDNHTSLRASTSAARDEKPCELGAPWLQRIGPNFEPVLTARHCPRGPATWKTSIPQCRASLTPCHTPKTLLKSSGTLPIAQEQWHASGCSRAVEHLEHYHDGNSATRPTSVRSSSRVYRFGGDDSM